MLSAASSTPPAAPSAQTPPQPRKREEPSLEAKLVRAFLHSQEDLISIATDHGLSFAQLSELILADKCVRVFNNIRALAQLRSDLIGSQIRIFALQRLNDILLASDNHETTRRAAVWILRATQARRDSSPLADDDDAGETPSNTAQQRTDDGPTDKSDPAPPDAPPSSATEPPTSTSPSRVPAPTVPGISSVPGIPTPEPTEPPAPPDTADPAQAPLIRREMEEHAPDRVPPIAAQQRIDDGTPPTAHIASPTQPDRPTTSQSTTVAPPAAACPSSHHAPVTIHIHARDRPDQQ